MTKIRWGLIGASTIARQNMVAAITDHADGIITAVMSSNEARGKKFATEFAIPQSFTSVDQMLRDAPIDAVYISTTNELHCPQTLAAAAAKKHVLCEKPLALSVADARLMVAACHQAKVIFGTNHHLRHAESHAKIRELVQNGAIGQPLFARVNHATYLPENRQGWRIDRPDAGGGVILDITVHDVDTLRYVLGAEPIAAVGMSQGGTMTKNNLPDGVMAALEFDNGVLAQIHSAFTTKYAGNGLEVHGTKGSVIGRNVMSQRSVGEVFLHTERGEEAFAVRHDNLYGKIVRLFHQAIKGAANFTASGEDGLRALAISLAIDKACRSGQRVAIDG
ncbi:MAG: Gfo/Idh/MocA family oxidoreductase [Alphaproteobacteria bacterium]|nr:Gfo/Idh/MocA family oxidoreductase [Alphaproteobacteria bacterium]